MFWSFFKKPSKSFLGIDIGTSSIKMVELSCQGQNRKLENYGEVKASALYEKSFRTRALANGEDEDLSSSPAFNKSTLLLSNQDIAWAIKAIIKEAGIKTHQAIFSIPDFSSFFTSFELPPMTKEELPQAVRYEARLHVPLPLKEVVLDWMVVRDKNSVQKRGTGQEKLKILLVAVTNKVVNQYQEVAALAGLQLFTLEAEAFGLLRSLIKGEAKDQVIVLLDIGARSTTCSIIDKGVLKTSHSFDMAGNELTKTVAKSLNIDYNTAEKLKRRYGLLSTRASAKGQEETLVSSLSQELELGQSDIKKVLLPLVDVILMETERVSENFCQQEKKEIQKIIIAGSTALLPGLKECFQDRFNKEIEIANPFSDIFYPSILENTLKDMGPAYAIGVGMALRGLE